MLCDILFINITIFWNYLQNLAFLKAYFKPKIFNFLLNFFTQRNKWKLFSGPEVFFVIPNLSDIWSKATRNIGHLSERLSKGMVMVTIDPFNIPFLRNFTFLDIDIKGAQIALWSISHNLNVIVIILLRLVLHLLFGNSFWTFCDSIIIKASFCIHWCYQHSWICLRSWIRALSNRTVDDNEAEASFFRVTSNSVH
jgi:hypothetical protein